MAAILVNRGSLTCVDDIPRFRRNHAQCRVIAKARRTPGLQPGGEGGGTESGDSLPGRQQTLRKVEIRGHLLRTGPRCPGLIAVPTAVAHSPEIENRNCGDGQTSEAKFPDPKGSQICFHGRRLSRSRTKALIEKTVAPIAHADDAVAR